jgi:hypothetical protein
MPKPNPKVLVKAAADYLRRHPEEVVRLLKSALGLRLGIPLDALRYLADKLGQGPKAPKDVVIEAREPGLGLALTVKAMGSTLRVALNLYIEELEIAQDHLRITARISNMDLQVLDGVDTPVAGLIRSGALDLSKPGNLVAFMPKRPEALVEAKDDRIVIDLLKVPRLASDARLKRALGVLTPVLTVATIKTRDDHLDVQLRATPSRIGESVTAVRASSWNGAAAS